MKQLRLACVVTALVCAACSDNPASLPRSAVQEASHDISDATHATGNPHFFWLAPMVAQPRSDLFGTFQGMASPRVVLVCLKSNQLDLTDCDPDTPLASFDRDTGLEVADQQFEVNVDTHQLGLVATVDPDTAFTTYRLIVYTDSMADFGGRFILGYADIQLGENGSDVKNLSTGATIGLVDGRTLPVRFRIDAGAYEYALKINLATGTGDPQDEPLCQTNCSVTFVSPDSTTYAFLSDSSGQNVTGAEILSGDVLTSSVLVIDERITEGDNANCADGVSLDKKDCYRYRITPDVAFTNPIRIGICPTDVPLSSVWRILKVDYAADMTPILTRPDPVDVSDFLPCTAPSGSASLMQSAFQYAARWLVSPLMAQTEARVWGAMAKDLSDLFWGLDAEIAPVGNTDFTATTGTVVTPTVQVDSVLPGGSKKPFDGAKVTFRITGGTGALSLPAGENLVSSQTTNGRVTGMTVTTGISGSASIGWTIATGTNTLEVTSANAVTVDPATGAVHPIVFTATGTALFTAETVAAGNWHTCALNNGDVYCWGNNANGQLGNGTVENASTPVLVQPPSGVTFAAPVAGGGVESGTTADIAHTCAKTTDNAVYCWGSNAWGALGDGSPTTSYSSTPVLALSDVLGPVTVASYVTCTTQPSRCWGLNSNGQLGDGTFDNSSTPVAVAGDLADSLRQISAGEGHTCALTAGGRAVCWGWNGFGQLGRGTAGDYQPTPAPVTGGLTFTDLDANGRYTCAVTAAGAMYCWGHNNGGQLGDGTMEDRWVPTRVKDPPSGAVRWRSVSAGYYHTCGLTDTGAIYCWGPNSYGELGTGDHTFSEAPTVPVAGGFTWLQLSAGDSYTCAISAGSVVYCWGRNHMGQLGDGTTTNRSLPEPVSAPGS